MISGVSLWRDRFRANFRRNYRITRSDDLSHELVVTLFTC